MWRCCCCCRALLVRGWCRCWSLRWRCYELKHGPKSQCRCTSAESRAGALTKWSLTFLGRQIFIGSSFNCMACMASSSNLFMRFLHAGLVPARGGSLCNCTESNRAKRVEGMKHAGPAHFCRRAILQFLDESCWMAIVYGCHQSTDAALQAMMLDFSPRDFAALAASPCRASRHDFWK